MHNDLHYPLIKPKLMKLVSAFIVIVFLIAVSSCTRDKITEEESECSEAVTYESDIEAILNNTCAYTGCHAGGAPGNFASYAGVSDYIEGDEIERRVLVQRNMPPNYATQGPTSLTEEEIELFKCWVEAGYPEN